VRKKEKRQINIKKGKRDWGFIILMVEFYMYGHYVCLVAKITIFSQLKI